MAKKNEPEYNLDKVIEYDSLTGVDASYLLTVMDKCIERVEESCKKGKPDDIAVENVVRIFKKVLGIAQIQLTSAIDSVYGVIFQSRPVKINLDFPNIAGVTADSMLGIMFNPLMMYKFNFRKFLFVIVHEVMHVALGHISEMVTHQDRYDHNLANIAMDCSINQIIENEVDIGARFNKATNRTERGMHGYSSRNIIAHPMVPDQCVTLESLRTHLNMPNLEPLKNWRYYYNILRMRKDDQNVKNLKPSLENNPSSNQQGSAGSQQAGNTSGSSGQSSGGDGQGDENSSCGQDDGGNGQGNVGDKSKSSYNSQKHGHLTTRNNAGERVEIDVFKDTAASKSDVEAAVRQALKEAMNAHSSMGSTQRGYIPEQMQASIDELIKEPKLNWKRALEQLVGTIPVPFRKTRKRLSRRNPYNPKILGKLPKHKIHIICAIDTSGSMSDEVLSYCMGEIFGMLGRTFDIDQQKVLIIECDAAIHNVYEASRKEDVNTKPKGRGGTAFTPVIDYINNHPEYRESLLIYMTDGYGENSIPKPMVSKLMWLIMDSNSPDAEKHLSLYEPYGVVKALFDDKDLKELLEQADVRKRN